MKLEGIEGLGIQQTRSQEEILMAAETTLLQGTGHLTGIGTRMATGTEHLTEIRMATETTGTTGTLLLGGDILRG